MDIVKGKEKQTSMSVVFHNLSWQEYVARVHVCITASTAGKYLMHNHDT